MTPLTEAELAQQRAEKFVRTMLKEAASPNMGSFETDALAWPHCGWSAEELVVRLTAEFQEHASAQAKRALVLEAALRPFATFDQCHCCDGQGEHLEECTYAVDAPQSYERLKYQWWQARVANTALERE